MGLISVSFKAVIVKMIQSLTMGSLETKEKNIFKKSNKGKQQVIKRTKDDTIIFIKIQLK